MINKLKNFVDGAAQIASSENWDEGRAQEFISELAELKPEFDKYIEESIEEEEAAECINKQLEDWFERNSRKMSQQYLSLGLQSCAECGITDTNTGVVEKYHWLCDKCSKK